MSSQSEFKRHHGGQSQCETILAALTAREGQWVGLLDLYLTSGSMAVHSRINDLRKRGHSIEHRNKWVDGKCHSEYQLVPSSSEAENLKLQTSNSL